MTDPNLVRRLTTIVAIDVVAFSTMSARNEERALALLAARLDPAGTLVRQHRVRVFKMTGDGLLAEFASPVEAVCAALEIQEAMRSANAGAKADDHDGRRRAPGRCRPSRTCRGAVDAANPPVPGRWDRGDSGPGRARRDLLFCVILMQRPPCRPPNPPLRCRLSASVPDTVATKTVPRVTTPAASPVPTAPRAASQSSLAPRRFAARDVPLVPDFHWRALQNYADAPGTRAIALNVRGIFATAIDRIDEATARQAALEACNQKVERDVPIVRAYDL